MKLRNRRATRMAKGRALLWTLSLVSLSVANAPVAGADVILYGPTVVNGPSSDSSQADPEGFGAAIAGLNLTVLTFTETSDGTPIDLSSSQCEDCTTGEDTPLGNLFSDEVWFGSPDSSTSTNLVGLVGRGSPLNNPDQYMIYPMDSYSGRLEIDFTSAGTAARAVGVGLWVPSPSAAPQTLRVYDRNDEEIPWLFSDVLDASIATPYSYSGPNTTYVFIGLVATSDEDLIGRVVIDGTHYEVQDVSFVPEPAAGLMATAALFGLLGLAAAQRRHSPQRR